MPLLKAKAAPHSVRVERVVVQKKAKSATPLPGRSPAAAASGGLRASSSSASNNLSVSSSRLSSPIPRAVAARTTSASPYPSSSDERRRFDRKRKPQQQSHSPNFSTDDSDESDDDPFRKKRKVINTWSDPDRRVRHKRAFGDDLRPTNIINAADLASVKTGCEPIFGATQDEVAVELQYPSRCRGEK
jgi:[histone H3]-lysine79 N-trimethyltransferase